VPLEADDNALLAELGVEKVEPAGITKLTHVKAREEVRAAEEVANRTPCSDFDRFEPLFRQVKIDLDAKIRDTRRFGENAEIKQGEFFIVGGQLAYVANMDDEFVAEYGRPLRAPLQKPGRCPRVNPFSPLRARGR
jgi:hypothetical protein